MSVKAYLRGITPQLSIQYYDRPDGTSLGLDALDFNAGGEMDELVAQVAGIDNKSLDLRLGGLPSNLDVDLPLAGAILGWAWDVLRLRSADAVEASEPLPEPEVGWAPFDFGWEPTYAEQLDMAAEPPLEETHS